MQDSLLVLGETVGVIGRLQAISPGDSDLLRVIDLAVKSVKVLESGLVIGDGIGVGLGPALRSERSLGDTSLVLWGGVIMTLWRVVMGFDAKSPAWDGLALRLLVWRCVAGEKEGAEGEWARREALRNLRSVMDDG